MTDTAHILAYTAYRKFSIAQWKALVSLAKSEIASANRVANGESARRLHWNGRNTTAKALIRRGLLREIARENPTHGVAAYVEITQFGWNTIAVGDGSLRRPADSGRLSVEDAWNDVIAENGAMYSADEYAARIGSAARFGRGLLVSPEHDSSGITASLVSAGLAEHVAGEYGAQRYQLSLRGLEMADSRLWGHVRRLGSAPGIIR